MEKIDPVCGMKGTIPAHKHYFCSRNCIVKFEKQHDLKSTASFNWWFLLLYGVLATLILGGFLGYMALSMGIFLTAIALLKLIDLKGFANAFAMYDIVAKRSRVYAYAYPFIELALGLGYLFTFQLQIIAGITVVVMSIGLIGVAKNLFSKNPIRCACLGTWINIPLTKFTLFEDAVMIVMALFILLV